MTVCQGRRAFGSCWQGRGQQAGAQCILCQGCCLLHNS